MWVAILYSKPVSPYFTNMIMDTENSVRSHKGSCVAQYTVHIELNFITGDSFYWLTLLECINYSPWGWLSKGLNMFELSTVLLQRWLNPYPNAFPYGNGMVLHFYQQQESSTTKAVHKVINKGLKAYV